MKQRINLYQPEQQSSEHPVNARNLGLLLLACFSLLLIVASYNNSTLTDQQKKLSGLEQQRITLNSQFEQLSAEQFNSEADPFLQQQVKALTLGLAAAKDRQHWLDAQQHQQVQWSAILQTTLEAQTDQVRLTDMHVNAPENTLTLAGSTVDAALISAFLQNASEQATVDMGTDQLQLSRQSGSLNFNASLSLSPMSIPNTIMEATP